MAKTIQIDTERLRIDSDNVKERIDNIRSQLMMMEEQAAILDSMWSGPGSEAFKSVFHEDLVSLSTVLRNLESINKYEESALGRFERCGIKVSNAIEEIRV